MGECLSIGLNPNLKVAVYKANLKYDNNLFVEQIKEAGIEVSRNRTNVKAGMTKWLLTEYSSFRDLAIDTVVNHLSQLSEATVDGSPVSWVVHSIWGNVFSKGNHAVSHNHMPCIFSFVYYVKMPEGSSQLIFDDLSSQVNLEEGDLIIFPSHLQHNVPEHNVEEERVTIAGNITTAWPIEGEYVYEAKDIGRN